MNVGIVGCGTMGALHAQMAKACGLKVVACADTSRTRAKALSKAFRAEALTDASRLFARGDVDVVVIATPTPTHAGLIAAAARAGKQVFCETPFARASVEGRKAAAAARKAKVSLHVSSAVRYFPAYQAIEAQVASGRIGDVGFVRTFRGGAFPKGAGNWYRDYDQSGGAAFDLLIHEFDWIEHVFGPIESVFCQNLLRKMPTPLDYAMATVKVKNGPIAQLIGSWAHPEGYRVKAEVCGREGMIAFDSEDRPIAVSNRKSQSDTVLPYLPERLVSESPYLKDWRIFVEGLDRAQKESASADAALRALRCAELALQSAKSGKRMTVPE